MKDMGAPGSGLEMPSWKRTSKKSCPGRVWVYGHGLGRSGQILESIESKVEAETESQSCCSYQKLPKWSRKVVRIEKHLEGRMGNT